MTRALILLTMTHVLKTRPRASRQLALLAVKHVLALTPVVVWHVADGTFAPTVTLSTFVRILGAFTTREKLCCRHVGGGFVKVSVSVDST